MLRHQKRRRLPPVCSILKKQTDGHGGKAVLSGCADEFIDCSHKHILIAFGNHAQHGPKFARWHRRQVERVGKNVMPIHS